MIAASVLLIGLQGYEAVHRYSANIGGRRVFWLQDDMMISMRYARNLAQHGELVWNPGGERVEGYSNLGWVLVMAGIHLLPLPATLTSAGVLAVSLAASVWILALSRRLAFCLAPSAVLGPTVALACLLVCSELVTYSIMGLETIPVTALFLWLLVRVLRDSDGGGSPLFTFFAAGSLGILRVDGLLLSGLVVLFALLTSTRRRRVWLFTPLIVVLPALATLFRVAYYGYPLPNTYYLKVTGWDLSTRLAGGLTYSRGFFTSYGIPWLVAAAGAGVSRNRRAQALWVLGIPLILYGLWVGGDSFHGLRFLTPWVPVLLVLSCLSPSFARWSEGSVRHSGALIVLATSVWVTAGYRFGAGPSPELDFARAGLFLGEVTGSSTRIAHIWAGTVPYFADRPSIDLLGKCDTHVAHMAAQTGLSKPGHNKFDFAYSLGALKPHLVIQAIHPAYLSKEGPVGELARTDDAYLARLYLDPTFQARYAPRVAFLGALPVFIAADAEDRGRLMSGRCATIGAESLLALGLREACWPEIAR